MDGRGQAFVLLTHFASDEIAHESSKLARASDGLGESWLLLQKGGGRDLPFLKSSNVMTFATAELLGMGYATIGPSMIPGHVYFPLLKFYRENPGFKFYWLIENDVRFTEDWSVLFGAFGPIGADFLASHIRPHREEPDWCFWDLSSPRGSIRLAERLRCFHPIFRISNAALAFIHQALRDGWRGHSEVLLPTLLHRHGFELADFGGTGRFVPESMENRFYLDSEPNPQSALESESGTMRFRPPFVIPGPRKDTLYHPVKPSPDI